MVNSESENILLTLKIKTKKQNILHNIFVKVKLVKLLFYISFKKLEPGSRLKKMYFKI